MILDTFSGSKVWILEKTILVASYESMLFLGFFQKPTCLPACPAERREEAFP
jgi:hypothetical protein